MRQPRRSSRSVVVTLAALGLGASMLGGCTKDRLAKYRENPTPELETLSERQVDTDNQWTVTNDENLRSLNRDFSYFSLLDRPTRLTPKPVPW